jgi:hypothetical protein
MGKIYQITNMDRRKAFMGGLNPDDPLGIRFGGGTGARDTA